MAIDLTKTNPLVILIVSIIIIVLAVFTFQQLPQQKCVPEHGSIGYGVGMKPTGKCCAGLIPKAPSGFTGGAFCMKPECEIECGAIGSKSEGLYNTCDNSLIKYIKCGSSSCINEGQSCIENQVGCCNALVCSSPCFCENGELICATTLICLNPSDETTSCEEKKFCKDYFENHPETKDGACYYLWNPVCGSDGKTYANDCIACMSRVDWYTSGEC